MIVGWNWAEWRLQSCIDHIKTASDVDPWAKELVEKILSERMERMKTEAGKTVEAFRNCVTEPKCKGCPKTEVCIRAPGNLVSIPKPLALDMLNVLNEQERLISKAYDMLDDVCKDVREQTGGDYVCGLCQYDGAYMTDSGDYANECPGFDSDECFCMKNEIREEFGKPLVPEPE